jgi:hypothetical protein
LEQELGDDYSSTHNAAMAGSLEEALRRGGGLADAA